MRQQWVSWVWRTSMGLAGVVTLAASPAIAQNESFTPPQLSSQLLNTEWLLEDLAGTGVVDRVQTTLRFEASDRITGQGGCNHYSAKAVFTNDQLSVSGIAATKKLCPPAVMNQETRYFQALKQAQRITLEGPYLLIYSQGEAVPLRFTQLHFPVRQINPQG